MADYYEKDGKWLARCTKIISDCTDKSAPLTQWAANMVVGWIEENCEFTDIITKDGFEHQSVYVVTDDHLDSARKNFREVSQAALDVGSEVHAAIEKYLLLKMQEETPENWEFPFGSEQGLRAFDAFLKWQREHELKPIALEQTVYGNGWAGTCDYVGWFAGKLYVIDWKSSAGYYPEMRYQVAAYRNAADISSHFTATVFKASDFTEIPEIEGCGILRLDKTTGLPEWHDTSKSYEQDLKVFNRMVDLYFERHPRIKKKAGL